MAKFEVLPITEWPKELQPPSLIASGSSGGNYASTYLKAIILSLLDGSRVTVPLTDAERSFTTTDPRVIRHSMADPRCRLLEE